MTWAKVQGSSIDEVEQASAAIEFGEEECGIGLLLSRVDPFKAWLYATLLAATFSEYPASVAAYSHGGLFWDLCFSCTEDPYEPTTIY